MSIPITTVVTGKVTGDCECWCLEVTKEDYIRIKGQNSYDSEMEWQTEMARELGQEFIEPSWYLYPSDLIDKHIKDRTQEIEISVTVRELE